MENSLLQIPWKLVPNHIRAEGGREIDRFRGMEHPQDTDSGAEAWIGSVTRANGATPEHPDLGCAEVILPDGTRRYLYQVIRLWPEKILGPAHLRRFGEDLGILVKFLDAKQKFLLQCHPSRATAARLWDSAYGKTECWHVLGVREEMDPHIFLGFKLGITREAFERAYRSGTLDQIETMCHRLMVRPGETYYVPGGMPHALGEGCFVLEVQESTDLTAVPIPQKDLLAFRRRANPAGVFHPIDEQLYDARTLGSFDYTGHTLDEILSLTKTAHKTMRSGAWGEEQLLIGQPHTSYFECVQLSVRGGRQVPLTNAHRIQIGIVAAGKGSIVGAAGSLAVSRGDELFFSHACDDLFLSGDVTIIFCRPGNIA